MIAINPVGARDGPRSYCPPTDSHERLVDSVRSVLGLEPSALHCPSQGSAAGVRRAMASGSPRHRHPWCGVVWSAARSSSDCDTDMSREFLRAAVPAGLGSRQTI